MVPFCPAAHVPVPAPSLTTFLCSSPFAGLPARVFLPPSPPFPQPTFHVMLTSAGHKPESFAIPLTSRHPLSPDAWLTLP